MRGLAIAIGLLAGLSSCVGNEQVAFPSSTVRNSPLPVPVPRMKPPPPARKLVMPAKPRGRPARPVRATGSVIVRPGDTVYGIARRTGVSLKQLVQLNGLKPPYLLHPGDRLKLPAQQRHRVRRGETLYRIADRYDVPVRELAVVNGLKPPYVIRPGQELVIPTGRGEAMAVAGAGRLPPPPPRSGGFGWPVIGRIIATFGPKPGGLRNDGINIAAPRGAPVRATDAGVVAYAGDGIRAFGKLILIRHGNGWVSAYAHNDELLVHRGDVVRRGQIIARVGQTGLVDSPQLHFELRRGKRPVDPLRHLPPLAADHHPPKAGARG